VTQLEITIVDAFNDGPIHGSLEVIAKIFLAKSVAVHEMEYTYMSKACGVTCKCYRQGVCTRKTGRR